ncbi:MAG TPA: biopolymer transporter ExbD [Candidatus Tectomicrobia bacterium]
MRQRVRRRVGSRQESPPIELTNLTDVALMLAFIGLLVPHFVLVPTVDLATSTGTTLAAVPRESVTILLRQGETVYWNRDEVSWSELQRRVQEAKTSSQPPKIFLTGERSVPLGLNIDVRTLLQGTDFVEFALHKEP